MSQIYQEVEVDAVAYMLCFCFFLFFFNHLHLLGSLSVCLICYFDSQQHNSNVVAYKTEYSGTPL